MIYAVLVDGLDGETREEVDAQLAMPLGVTREDQDRARAAWFQEWSLHG